MIMSTVNMSLRIEPELKRQAESVLSQLGMTLNGTITMFLNQIVRDQAVPLTLSLSSEQSLCADLLRAKAEREQGEPCRDADDVLKGMRTIVEEAKRRAV